MHFARWFSPLLILLALLSVSAGPAASIADAQYFGRNQVRYETFDFHVLKTEHFDIYHYPEEREAVELAARMAERWYARLSRILSHELAKEQPIILYASHPHFEQTTALQGRIGEATGGATEPLKRRVVLPLAGPLAETDHVLGHELVHAFQFDITAQAGSRVGFTPPTALFMPLWFIEGMAEYLSVGPIDPHTAMWMRDAARTDELPTVLELANPRFFPYRYGQALWAYIAGRWGDQAVGEILRTGSETGDALHALVTVLGVSPDSLSSGWRQAIREAYSQIAEETNEASDYGRPLITAEQGGGELNLAPALSPDARWLVFLSEKDRFSIEMFLADAETGAIERKIVKTALDPHFESLQFINSAGAWHPDGRRFVFAGISKGKPVVSVLDVDGGRIEREFLVREAHEVFTPTWSPDGRYVAFSAIAGGLSDLFMLDFHTGDVQRLTNDSFADLQPSWSPDGQSLAFVTDRFSSDLSTLEIGNYRLALIDPESGDIRPVTSFDDAKNVDPHWSPDGSSLYFLSDRGGITNIYRLDLSTDEVFQVTDLLTGVSGITHLSPAISVAMRADRLVFTTFEERQYNLYAIDSLDVLAGEPVVAPPRGEISAAVLPPKDRPVGDVMALLDDPALGLPPSEAQLDISKYRAGLSLDFIAPPSVGVGTGAFGGYIGGGSALVFSDMLGRRNLGTVLQVNGGFEDIALIAAYQNRRLRWNWGLIAGQVPFLSFDFKRTETEVNNERAVEDSIFLFRQTDRQLTGVLSYPFSRLQRIEFTAGYRHLSFDEELITRTITTLPPQVTINDEIDLPAPRSVHLGEASVALVYDNSLFGATSPILGQRYRVQISPKVGGLNYYSVLVDLRRYIRPVTPYTIAGRIVHFGRYGGDSEDERLLPLFIGYQTLVRGYSQNSFDVNRCRDLENCPIFPELFGSRMLLSNLELRFPLFQGLGLGRPPPGLPPLELAFFFDAGVAWLNSNKASFLGGGRDPITSYGAALRVNLFGVAVVELDYVHPNDRPDRDWHFALGITPGF